MNKKLGAFFLLMLLAPAAVFSAKMISTWKDQTANASSLQFSKVLVVATIKQEFTRKVAEDKAVRIIKQGGKTNAEPSYTILGNEELSDRNRAKAKIQELGFDGVIVMRYAAMEQDPKKYDRGEDWDAYNYFWGAYYPAWGGVYNSTTPDEVKVYIETMFYSLKEDKLIWAGITETKNPKNAAKVVGEIAEETTKYLKKQGLLRSQ